MKLKTPKELGITARQYKNLCKLITFVRTKVEPPKFNICDYYTAGENASQDGGAYPAKATYECGTSACFCGYGPLAGIKPKKSDDWFSYQEREFGSEALDGDDFAQRLHQMLFDGAHLNCRDAAVKRGAYFLVHGIPDSWKNWTLKTWEAPASFRAPWKLIEEAAK